MELNIKGEGVSIDLNKVSDKKIPLHMRVLEGGSYIKQMESGIYTFLPLGKKVIDKIYGLFKDSLKLLNGREYIFPIAQSKSLWQESGRLEKFKKTIAKTNDELVISPSHEEIACSMFDNDSSYKNLPFSIFSMGQCFREEIRPKNSLLRSRNFLLFDGYIFTASVEQQNNLYQITKDGISSALKKLGIDPLVASFHIEADDSEWSEEFVIKLEHIGESRILECPRCYSRFRANQVEKCVCGNNLKLLRGVEFADVLRYGTRHSEKTNIHFKGKDGNRHPFHLLAFGIGLSKLLGILVEQTLADARFVWPREITPYDLAVIPSKNNGTAISRLKGIIDLFDGIDYLMDDRDMTIGRRLKEIEIFGIPFTVIIQKNGNYELIDRINNNIIRDVGIEGLTNWLVSKFRKY